MSSPASNSSPHVSNCQPITTLTDAPRDDANSPKALLAALVTVLCWASAFIAIRGAGPHFDPGSMALLRMAVGTVALGLIALVKGIKWPTKRQWLSIVIWGVAWFCVYNIALNAAERSIDAGTAALVVNLAPLMVVVFSGLFLGEGFPRQLIIGAPLAFAGVALIAFNTSSGGKFSPLGLVLALLAAVAYAGCTILQKQLLADGVDSTTLTFTGAAAGTVALLPWASKLFGEISHAPASATWSVIYMGIFPTAIAFTTWAYVLKRATAGRTAATTYVVPVLVIFLSWLILGETPTVLMLLGGFMCLAGVILTRLNLPTRQRQR